MAAEGAHIKLQPACTCIHIGKSNRQKVKALVHRQQANIINFRLY